MPARATAKRDSWSCYWPQPRAHLMDEVETHAVKFDLVNDLVNLSSFAPRAKED